MSFTSNTKLGNITVSKEVLATVAGGAAGECYGVIGMASQRVFKDGLAEILKKENFSKGIIVTEEEDGVSVDMYIIIGYGSRISEIVIEVQKKVKYVLEKTFDIHFKAINVFVQGVKVVE